MRKLTKLAILFMKKILTIILTLCMCLFFGMALTACDFGSKDTDSWASYFEFDNVTATKTQTQVYTEEDIRGEAVQVQKIEIADSKWLLNRESTYGEPGSSITLTDTVYFDGQNAYCDGVLNTDLNSENEGFFFGADFSVYESSFTETATGVFEADEISVYGVYTYTDVCITIRDGKIVSIEYTMNVSESYENYSATISYVFDLWGNTTIDSEKYTQPSAWASYFEFDNVTATKTSSTYYPEYDMTISDTENIKVQGDKWLWEKSDYYYNDTVYDKFAVYFDGSNAYVNGVVDNEMNSQSMIFFLGADFSAYESAFTETATGVFEADEVSAYGVYNYTDVRITIRESKIASIEYTMNMSISGTNYTQTIAYTFDLWDNTTIDGEEYTQPSAWLSYFDFKNVTITQELQYVKEETDYQSVGASWKVNGDAWICVRDAEMVDGVVTDVDEIYFDGTNYYLNGDLVSEEDVETYHYLATGLLGVLVGYENSFSATTEGSKITYTADSINFYEIIFYTDIELVIENGKITKLTYVQNEAVLDSDTDTYYDGTYTLTFSDYGTTVVSETAE